MINRTFFFENVRQSLYRGSLPASASKGLGFILDCWEKNYSQWDDRWLAYALGTTHLETGAKMMPIHEIGGTKYFEWNYGPEGHNPKRAKSMGDTEPGDGAHYHGRGYVQLTWKNNYKAMGIFLSKKLSRTIDLVGNPDLALQPGYAADIMFHGMSEGTFTGHKFVDYFTKDSRGRPAKDNWIGARAIINGTDKAQIIADLGHKYYASIGYL